MKKGFATLTLVVPVLASLILILGAVIYKYAATDKDVPPQHMTEEDLQTLLSFFEAKVMLSDTEEEQDQAGSDALQAMQQYVTQETPKILAMKYCDATMLDIFQALRLAEMAVKAGLKNEDSQLFEWSHFALRSLISEAVLAQGPKILDTHDMDELLETHKYDERQELYEEARNIQLKRDELGTLANRLGLRSLSNKIMNGQYIQPMCIQLWNVDIDASYDYEFENNWYEHWQQRISMKDVPVYKYDPDLEIPYMFKKFTKQSVFLKKDGAMNDAEEGWIPYEFPKGVDWTVKIDEVSHSNLWDYKIKVVVETSMTHLQEVYHSGFSSEGAEMFQSNTVEIPMINFWKTEPFTVNADLLSIEDEGETESGSLKLLFTPSKRLSIEELREMSN